MKYLLQKAPHYFQLMRLNRPVGIFLLLWPTLWSLWIAEKIAQQSLGNANNFPSLKILIIFMLGVVVMRSLGCVVNDYADRHWDGLVERTKGRPLVTQVVSGKEALILTALLLFVACGLVLFLNHLSWLIACFALIFAIIYPFTKRFTYWPQAFLGLSFACAIPMAFAAILDFIPPIAWLIFAIGVLWPIIYDTQYAMVDWEDDLRAGIKSTAILFGRFNPLIIFLLQVLMLVLLLLLGNLMGLKSCYYWGLFGAALLMIYQNYLIRRSVKTGNFADCFKAFLNNQWVGFLIFIGIFMG